MGVLKETRSVVCVVIYRVILKSLWDFRPLRYSRRHIHAEREHVNRGRDKPYRCSICRFCCVYLGCCAAEFETSGWIYELTCVYWVSQEECARIREGVPYVKVYRFNPKHLCPNLNGYGENGQWSLKLWQLLHIYWLPNNIKTGRNMWFL